MRFKFFLAVLAILFGAAGTLSAQSTENQGNIMNSQTMFPLGEKLPEKLSRYFIGQAYIAPVATSRALNCPVFNVTFEPGCRNNWHKHTGGQLLLAVNGEGLYQERGKPSHLLRPGDAVEIAPGVEHWHGATANHWFSHLAVETNSSSNENTWLEPVNAAEYAAAQPQVSGAAPRLTAAAVRNRKAFLPNQNGTLKLTDPELVETFDNFAFDDIYGQTPQIDREMRFRIILASLLASGSLSEYRIMLAGALDNGISPVEVKEILYQAVPYLGMAKTVDFLTAANEILGQRKIALPLAEALTTDRSSRLAQGMAVQKAIFGDSIEAMQTSSPQDLLHIQKDLSAHCFGDTYTRKGLDLKTRELLTFCLLISLGGCESQVKGHVAGNAKMGNDRKVLIGTVTALLPYIGYPRALNALACINEILPENAKK